MPLHSHSDYKANPFLATGAIGTLLRNGCLNLFLGAGVSKGFGFPDWATLVAGILGKDGDLIFVESLRQMSDKDMATLLDPLDIDDKQSEYLSKVHSALYKGIADNLFDQLPRSPLLLAVTALLIGSCRGRINSIFTYNYDNLLEQYLKMLGYATCLRTNPSDFSSKADVEINHVHGFLPQSWKIGEPITRLILSERSYRIHRAGIDKGWSAYVEHSLYAKTGLFLGLSGNDGSMLDIIQRAKPNINRPGDYFGYWIMTPDAYDRNGASILDVGMCPIPVTKEELPKFIFLICQDALIT